MVRKRSRKSSKIIGAALALGLTATFSHYAGGSMPPHIHVYEQDATRLDPAATAAVVFTGERQRVPAALRLYMEGKVDYVFITGYASRMDANTLLAAWHIAPTRDTGGIFFERGAQNTEQNAAATTSWLNTMRRTHGVDISNIVLVTGDYHMHRATTNVSRSVLRSVGIYQLPVATDAGMAARAAEGIKATLTDMGISGTAQQVRWF